MKNPDLLYLSLALVLVGCSFHIQPQDPALALDLGTSQPDLAIGDLAGRADLLQGPMPDLLVNPCKGKQNTRICDPSSGTSGLCDGQMTYQQDRVCAGSGCDSGYCGKPNPATPCTSDGKCTGSRDAPRSCQIFTNLFNLYGEFCAPPPGLGGRLDPCQRHSDCIWNACYPFAQGLRCLKPCASDNDCDGSAGSCGPATITIEGFGDTIYGCAR